MVVNWKETDLGLQAEPGGGYRAARGGRRQGRGARGPRTCAGRGPSRPPAQGAGRMSACFTA